MKENEILLKILNLGKIIIGLLIVISVVLIIGVSKLYSNNNVNTDSTSTEKTEYNTEYDVSMFEEIKAGDIKTKTKGELKVVYVGRESCGWCAAFLPNLWQAQDKYKFTTLYVDIAKIINFEDGSILDENAYATMMDLTGEDYKGYMEENFGATPMVLIMKDNKIVNAQTGYSEYADFETLLNNAGIK